MGVKNSGSREFRLQFARGAEIRRRERARAPPERSTPTPQPDLALEADGWGVSGPSTVRVNGSQGIFDTPFSATCFYFGRELDGALRGSIPIGLIAVGAVLP